jgi:hypothetical protein
VRTDDFPDGRRSLGTTLDAAAAHFEGRGKKRIILFTDGIAGDRLLEKSLASLRRRDIEVHVVTPPKPHRVAGAVRVSAPERAWLGEPFTIRAFVGGTEAGPAEVILSRNGVPVGRAVAAVDTWGRGSVNFVQEADRVGPVTFSVAVDGQAYAPVSAVVEVAGSPQVRYIGDDPKTAENLIGIFRDAGVRLRVSRPVDLAWEGDPFRKDDVVIVDDPAPASLNDNLLRRLRKAVGEDGKGLIVIGGRKGLGSEEFSDSGIEEMLPVVSGYTAPPEPEPVSLIIALDTSFSMFYRGRDKRAFYSNEPRKIEVAREAAKEVIRAVRPDDSLGLIGNSTDLFWIQELGPIGNRRAVEERVNRVQPEGKGINFYSIIREAYDTLKRDRSAVRHVLVFGDAEDIDQYEVESVGHSFDLVRQMARDGITLSVVAIGLPTDKDIPFLRTASLLGKGDFYLVADLRALPRYFVSEYRKLSVRHFFEGRVLPRMGDYTSVLRDMDENLPPLEGISLVTPRERAVVPIRTDTGAPLLTLGSYGSGKTAVFASDNGYRWAPRWSSGKRAAAFWTQLLFAVTADSGADAVSSSLYHNDASERISYSFRGADGSLPGWDRLWLHDVRGKEPPIPLLRRGLVRYDSEGPLPPSGLYSFKVTTDEEGSGEIDSRFLFLPSPPEDLPYGADWPLLERIMETTGGEWVTQLERFTRPADPANVGAAAFAAWCLAAGLALLLAETLFRNYLRR